MTSISVAACQVNPVVGDLAGNVERVVEATRTAERLGADLAVFPELTITGYPPEDLLLRPQFIEDNLAALEEVARHTGDVTAVVGFVDRGMDLYNAAAVCQGGRVHGTYHKQVLPNYGVFDEQRYFAPAGPASQLYRIAGVRVGISVCEDAWVAQGPIAQQAAGGAELIVNLNASPFYAGRHLARESMIATRAADASTPLVYVNQVGAQDELVFDGGSMVHDASGALLANGPQFVESVFVTEIDVRPAFRKRLLDPRGRAASQALPVVNVSDATERKGDASRCLTPSLDPCEETWNALVLGVRDYVTKNGFGDVVIGLSGGVDSSIVAAIAADALGADRVHGVSMPSRFSSEGSKSDAEELAQNLGIEMRTAPIGEAHEVMGELLKQTIGDSPGGLTDENLQSRLRGVTLMALSNEFGWLVLTTGNKSEMAVGYSTLYGDTAGGFAVIKDVPKTRVYELCRWRNQQAGGPVIPESVLTKEPSAELRPDQRDQDSLPPYDVLDPILECYIEQDLSAPEIEALGHDPEVVRRVVALIDRAEYKRRQSPLGVRVTPKAFGKDRRMPITNRYAPH